VTKLYAIASSINKACVPSRVEKNLCFLKQDLVLFSKKTEKPHSELFLFHHAISLFSELHNNNLLYLL